MVSLKLSAVICCTSWTINTFSSWDVPFFPDASQEFLQRGTAVLGSSFSELVSRLRQIFRCLWQMNGIVAVVVEMFWIVFFRSFPGRGDGCFSLIQEWKVLGSQKILWVACWNQIYWDYFSTLKRNLYRWMNHIFPPSGLKRTKGLKCFKDLRKKNQ